MLKFINCPESLKVRQDIIKLLVSLMTQLPFNEREVDLMFEQGYFYFYPILMKNRLKECQPYSETEFMVIIILQPYQRILQRCKLCPKFIGRHGYW